jgi:hypothetical protein
MAAVVEDLYARRLELLRQAPQPQPDIGDGDARRLRELSQGGLSATAGGEALIVSGDRHLLALGSWREFAIQSPADFLQSLANWS